MIALRIDADKVELTTIVGIHIEEYLKYNKLNFSVTLDKEQAYENTNFVIIASPT